MDWAFSSHDNNRRKLFFALAGAGTMLGPARLARAQSAPPLRLVVPFTPGGSTDILARALAEPLARELGRTVLVDNRPGAGGSIAAQQVATSAPDGNTLMMGHIGTLAVNPALYKTLGYDPATAFAPISLVARVPNVLVVHRDLGVRTAQEFAVRLAGSMPLTYGSGGNGSAAHIAFAYLQLRLKLAKTAAIHVPYKGTAPAVNDLLGGQINALFTGTPPLLQHIASGRLVALAVSSAKRQPVLAQVPTVAETLVPNFEADQWYGLVGPAGLPASTINVVHTAVAKVMTEPAVQQRFATEGAVAQRETPERFGHFIQTEMKRWKDVAQAASIQL